MTLSFSRLYCTLFLVLLAPGFTSSTGLRCVDIFSNHPIVRQSSVVSLNLQEAIWAARLSGDNSKANELKGKFLEAVRHIESLSEIPKEWEIISTDRNTNTVYRADFSDVSVVVKIGDRIAKFEPLLYKIADLLNVPVPITVKIKIGSQEGSAQIYMDGWKTAQTYVENGVEIRPNLLFQFFDHLTVNVDRSHGRMNLRNLMVRPDNPRGSKQVGIDNELVFNHNGDFFHILDRPFEPFLRENIIEISKKFPEFHNSMKDARIQEAVLDLILESGIELQFLHWGHVENGFKDNQRISDELGI